MGGIERDLRLHIDADLGHARSEALLTQSLEGRFAFPDIHAVAHAAVPPGDVRDASIR